MIGVRHLVRCKCYLPQFSKLEDPPFHEFHVFSIIDDEDNVKLKYAQCPNCGIVHKVVDICRSEFVAKEHLSSVVTIDDIKMSLDDKLIDIFEQYDVDVTVWEKAKFMIENEEWDNFILLEQDNDESGLCQGKYLRIFKRGVYSIESYAREEFISI